MALNPNIILAGQPVDVVGAMDAGNVAGQRARQFQDANALNGFMRERGADVLRNDAGAVNALAQMGAQGLQMAQGVQGNALDMKTQQLRMDATRQDMELARKQDARLDRAEELKIADYAQSIGAAQAAQEAEQIKQAVAGGLAAQTPEQWDQFVGSIAPELVGQFESREMIAQRYLSVADALERNTAPDTISYIISGEQAAEQGLDPASAYNITSGPGGMKATAIGGGGTNVTVNNGNEAGRYLYGSDAGVPAGWRVDRETGVASPIPGGPAAVEENRGARQQDNRETQSRLRLGTTLESLNLNIETLEGESGLPVTGAVGDARRTFVGRALTGDSAVDFGNRTDQITTSAALAEVQNMRDNSPAGGAVGQLTDSERIALGNSVTALNNSTSREEYLRAAKSYRQLALDLAYGPGSWSLNSDGTVSIKDQPSGAAASFANMSREDLLSVDTNSLDDAALDALMKRMDELGL